MKHGRYLFVSDLHLDGGSQHAVAQFLGFLETEARQCDALYILGDLFESWIGDDDADAVRTRVCDALAALTRGGAASSTATATSCWAGASLRARAASCCLIRP
jgi:hypothetical protein